MGTIRRQTYIDKIEKYLGKETIIVLVGQRRVGKSCILKMIRDDKMADSGNNVIYIDKEKWQYDAIQTYQDLNDYIEKHWDKDKHNYILIDEVQDIKEFERSVRSFRTEPNTDIVITGSNAKVINYVSFLCEAYILHKVNRYDIHGKRIFENNDKFYFEDNGVRNAIAGGTREGDIEKVIENIIYQHLIRLGYQVCVGQLQAGEIDFVCTKPEGQRVYVQASYIIAEQATREREFGNLRSIKDNYPKYVISMTPLLTKNDDDGITHIHLRKFLREGL